MNVEEPDIFCLIAVNEIDDGVTVPSNASTNTCASFVNLTLRAFVPSLPSDTIKNVSDTDVVLLVFGSTKVALTVKSFVVVAVEEPNVILPPSPSFAVKVISEAPDAVLIFILSTEPLKLGVINAFFWYSVPFESKKEAVNGKVAGVNELVSPLFVCNEFAKNVPPPKPSVTSNKVIVSNNVPSSSLSEINFEPLIAVLANTGL